MKRKIFNSFMSIVVMVLFLATQNAVAYAEEGTASTYTVAKGDCLYSIAKNVLGDEKKWKELYDLNSSSIDNPSLIYVGQILTLPNSAAASTEAVEQAGSEQDSQNVAAELAKSYIEKANAAEPTVTSILQSMESDTVKLVGLDFKIKSEESLTRKILSDSHDLDITPEEAAAAIGDVLRYTLCTSTDNYVDTVDSTMKKLTSAGMKAVVFKNTWGGTSYKGINSRFQTPQGVIFELQFHTDESYKTKEEVHVYYEIVRAEDKTQEEKDKAQTAMDELFARVPIPDGAIEYQWPTK